MTTCFRFLLLAALVLGAAASVRAQLAVTPEEVHVVVGQGETSEVSVTLSNAGEESVSFCLSFGRPLDRTATPLRLSDDALASACGEYGEVLYRVSQAGAGTDLNIYGLTMTPDGQLFGADVSGNRRTHELTQELEVVRSFFHPIVEELIPNPSTVGITYNPDTSTLWWANSEQPCAKFGCVGVERVLLLEGDLNGTPTGRRIELPIADEAPEPYDTGVPVGLSYEVATKLFYFVDFGNRDIWAVDTLGTIADGYPTQLEAYPGIPLGFGLDTHYAGQSGGSADSTDLWLEVATNLPDLPSLRRIVATNRFGETATSEGVPLETPLPEPNSNNSQTGLMRGEPLRSITDPNGLLYYPFSSFTADGVLGVRPHPLPPLWLALSQWDGTLGPGESIEITLTFSAGTRSVGNTYEAALQVFEAATGEALEVPLSLQIAESTPNQDAPGTPTGIQLSAYPNPAVSEEATVALSLGEPSEASVEVFDVLGRRVVVLHAGPLAAGSHRFAFGAADLPAGVYLVRAVAGRNRLTERVAVVR